MTVLQQTVRKVVIVEPPSLAAKLNKQVSSLSLESRHSIQSSFDSTKSYQRRVSFDNVTNIPPSCHSYTLKQCSRGFERTRRSRTFMIAMNLESDRLDPLVFALKNLVDEGDEIVVVGVCPTQSLEDRLSPKEKAQEIMDWIVEWHQGDNINMVVELAFGRPEFTLQEMMQMYQPSMLVVGSRNKTKYKHAYSGAGIFKYRLKRSAIPVVVVRDKQPPSKQQQSDDPAKSDIHYHHQPKIEASSHPGLTRRLRKTLSIFSCVQ